MARDSDAELDRLADELALEMSGSAHAGSRESDASSPSPAPTRASRASVQVQPDVGLVFTGGIGWFSAAPTPRSWVDPVVGGDEADMPPEERGHEPFPDNAGLFLQVQELEVSFRAAIDPFLRGDVYLAATPEGVEIEEAFLGTLALPAGWKLRVGWFHLPFGRFNGQHYLETSPFVDQPLPNRRFLGPEQLRGVGVEGSWLLPLPWYAMLYLAVSTAGEAVSFGAPSGERTGPEHLLTLGRLVQFHDLSSRWALQWGLSGVQGPHGEQGRTWILGADMYLKWRAIRSLRSVALQVEGMARRRAVGSEGDLEVGFYAQLAWRFARNWSTAARFDWLKALPLQQGAPPVGEPSLARLPNQWRVAASLSFLASEFHRWRVQYVFDRAVPRGDPAAEHFVHEVFLQYQGVMGAHGAHPF